MDATLLYESPFTDFDPLGVASVFDQTDTGQVIAILADIKAPGGGLRRC